MPTCRRHVPPAHLSTAACPTTGGPRRAHSAPQRQLGVIRCASSTFAKNDRAVAVARTRESSTPYHQRVLPHLLERCTPRATWRARAARTQPPSERSQVPRGVTARLVLLREPTDTRPTISTDIKRRSFPSRTTNNELCVYDVTRDPHSGVGRGAIIYQLLTKI